MRSRKLPSLLFGLLLALTLHGQTPPKITTPREALGFNIGDDYQVATYSQLEAYWKKLASESDRMKLQSIGKTEEGRPQYMAIISSPANLGNLDRYKEISRRLALAEGLSDEQARALANEGKAVVWIDGGLHATETVGAQQLMETVYQLVSATDAETLRFLNDVIVLCVHANPDGHELVSKWYMREPDPIKRSLNGLPRLYQKYAGHDNNRDFYMSNLAETTNMNRVLYREWFPQIMYNHHQTGPRGAVIFVPPFRDPFNYNFDPLIPLSIESVGTAIHSRFVAEGKPGSAMRGAAAYSTWYNGGLRTTTYFHNMIGILTEIIGSPTPSEVPLIPERQLPSGDLPAPVPPQTWRYRQSIDYSVTANRAILDYSSRNRETLLFNIYRMGRNSIERGSKDSWTITPKRIEALKVAAAKLPPPPARPDSAAGPRNAPGLLPGLPIELYEKILHSPETRDPRGYILPSDQPDFPTAVAFGNTLIKAGVIVHRAKEAFLVAGKSYPSGSLVVKCAQAFRPHVLDMFEPQDHPNDFRYPGGPPIPPYDNTGWTLAYQMGVQFDRILEAFDGPFEKLEDLATPPPQSITGPERPAGYLISHRPNRSFTMINRLLGNKVDVYWLKAPLEAEGRKFETGAIWVPNSSEATAVLTKGARELGVAVTASAKAPQSEALKLKPVRIGLVDQYGGSMPSGWTRFVFEQFEFPFDVVFPPALDAGDLREKYDVIVFADGAIRPAGQAAAGRRGGLPGTAPAEPVGTVAGAAPPAAPGQISPDRVPEEFRGRLGRFTPDKTLPQIRKFMESGGTVVTVGSSTTLAEMLALPVRSALTEKGADGVDRPLSREKFYVPGSILRADVDSTHPLAYGLGSVVDVFYENSPAFRFSPDAGAKGIKPIAWFSEPSILRSGWAWGQSYLDGTITIAEASVGEGKLFLLGPDVTYRGQPHGTFKLMFNSIYYGVSTNAILSGAASAKTAAAER